MNCWPDYTRKIEALRPLTGSHGFDPRNLKVPMVGDPEHSGTHWSTWLIAHVLGEPVSQTATMMAAAKKAGLVYSTPGFIGPGGPGAGRVTFWYRRSCKWPRTNTRSST